jgi:hypothetical protein
MLGRRLLILAGVGLAVAAIASASSGVAGTRANPAGACTLRFTDLGPDSQGSSYSGGPLATELPDGSVVVGGSDERESRLRIVLRRVAPDCETVTSFGTNGTATLSLKAGTYATVGVLAATADGGLLVGGGGGRHELVGHLLANGQPDPAFGNGGWVRIGEHAKPGERGFPAGLYATSIAIGPTGSIFVGGSNEGAHCCLADFVTELSAQGAPVRSFGREGVLPVFGGSYTTRVVANADGSVYASGEYEQSGGGDVFLVRIVNGRLDRSFDRAIVRSVGNVAPTRSEVRFTPTLVPGQPDGGFTLIGGFDKSFPFVRHETDSGIAVGILPSGRIDRSFGHNGETRFPSPNGAFNLPPSIRVESGNVLTAALGYADRWPPKHPPKAIVQAVSPDGLDARDFGRAGTRTIGLGGLFAANAEPSLGLIPALGGGAWIVVATAARRALIPVS